ncbi:hypothetical protein E3N88_26835 [Mikania micrantha]|uniref:Uncharacterized protein n=1 Tax=Mikania micrantha TaxID=192012 RepID=A0A5N6MWH6_9ASTR|nr:hypothetical protein E3N88_26835 [Mikania micrantha]
MELRRRRNDGVCYGNGGGGGDRLEIVTAVAVEIVTEAETGTSVVEDAEVVDMAVETLVSSAEERFKTRREVKRTIMPSRARHVRLKPLILNGRLP